MSLVCPSKTSFTDSELNQIYGDNIKHGVLPSSPFNSSHRESNGMLTEKSLSDLIVSLTNSGIIPQATPEKPKEFMEKQKQLLKNIGEEYCFYDSRYKYSLQKLLKSIQTGYVNNSDAVQQDIQKNLQNTQRLNQRLNDLSQIANSLTNKMLQTSSSLNAQISEFNKKIEEKQKKLQHQNSILSSNSATEKLNKEMVKFTEEKARYTNNLLKMYSFLNIVALGLLVYVYRSS
jgi:hypothetical protein